MINDVIVSYPKQINEVAFNLLGSHDTSRILSIAGGNKEKVKLAFLFMFTQGGSPCIYYGDEIGIDGEHKPGVEMHRKCMVWEEEKQDRDMLEFIKSIIKMRKENKELREVDNEWISTDNNVIVLKKQNITIIINNNDSNIEVILPDYLQNKRVVDLLNDKEIILKNKLKLNPFGYMVLKG